METVLAIYILAVSRLYKFDEAIILFQHWFRAILHSKPPADNHSGQVTTFLKKLKSKRFFNTTVQFSADFQEAQSFMILAASIATIIAFSQPVVFGGSDTWIAIPANKRIVILPATAGMISMTTTQLALHRLRKSSGSVIDLTVFPLRHANRGVLRKRGMDLSQKALFIRFSLVCSNLDLVGEATEVACMSALRVLG